MRRMMTSKFQDELRAAINDYVQACSWVDAWDEDQDFDPDETCEKRVEAKDKTHERLEKLIERCYDKKEDETIYKHQCGHCTRFSPLPFLVPGAILHDK
jgi:hypothetical protein